MPAQLIGDPVDRTRRLNGHLLVFHLKSAHFGVGHEQVVKYLQ